MSVKLSVVVAIVSDTTSGHCDTSHLEGTLQSLAAQIDPPSMEIVVPHHSAIAGITELKASYPKVRFIPVDNLKTFTGRGGSREHHDELRVHGLKVACGELIALIEDHGRAAPHWSASLAAAHKKDTAAVGGAIENGVDRPLNWAVYFCDFGKYQNPVPAGETAFASDANVAYKRSALDAIKPVWKEVFHETSVNWALREHGGKLVLSPDMVLYQHRLGLRLGDALRERFTWGRSYAATRGRTAGFVKRMAYAALSPLLPAVLLMRMAANVARKGRCIAPFLKALPLTALLAVSWSCGEFTGYLTGRATG